MAIKRRGKCAYNKHLSGKPSADAGRKGKAKRKGSRKKIA